LITATEMISHARNITGSVEVPVLADADTGYGNPINVIRTVQEYELKETGSVKSFADRMISFDDFTDILGLPEINALESKYGVRS
jgi:isocitrate lyase